LAIRSALNARASEGNLAVVEPLDLEEPRTKEIVGLLAGIGAEGSNVLLLTDGYKPNVYLSGRNLPGVVICPWGEASAYDVVWSDLVLIEASALADETETDGGEA
jgi:large subunit ribosomal protein L4